MAREDESVTLAAYFEGALAGEFWIGSTSAGRGRIDRAMELWRVVELAIKGLAAERGGVDAAQ